MTISLFSGYDKILRQVRKSAIAETANHIDFLKSELSNPKNESNARIIEICLTQSEKKLQYMKTASHRSDCFLEMAA